MGPEILVEGRPGWKGEGGRGGYVGVLGGQHVETSEMKGASRVRARVHLRMAWSVGAGE